MSEKLISYLNRFLSSKTGIFIALLIPLLIIPFPQSVRNVENILSSNWVQLWALFVIGHIQSKQSKHIKEIHKHLGVKS